MREQRFWTILTISGYLLAAVAAIVAHNAPATGHELSIYAETPLSFWVCVGGIVTIAVSSGIYGSRFRHGVILGSLLLLMLVALPIIRGYHYLSADAMTHLGIAKLIGSGGAALQQFYPMTHILAIVLHETTGLALRLSLMLLTPIFVLVFLIFVALSVTELGFQETRWDAVAIGFFSGFLVLPVNWFGVNLKPHPHTFATLAVVLPLFILFRSWNNGSYRYGLLLLFIYPFLIMLHPQQAVNLLLMLIMISLVIFIFRSQSKLIPQEYRGAVTEQSRFHYIQPVILGLLTLAYLSYFDLVEETVGTVVVNVFSGTIFDNTAVSSQSQSLSTIGVSVVELVLKIFGPGIVFGLIAGLIVGRSLKHILENRGSQHDQIVLAVALMALPLAIGFVVFYVGNFERLFLRYIGASMVVVTLLGGVGIARGFSKFDSGRSRLVIALVMGGLLVASIPTVQPSPYIVMSSGQITESSMEGYDTVFTYRHEGIELESIRTPTYRYEEAVRGKKVSHVHELPPYHFADHSLPQFYTSDRYLVVTERTRDIDIRLYEGFRYTKDDFAYLNSDPSISKVLSTGDLDLYLVYSTNETTANRTSVANI